MAYHIYPILSLGKTTASSDDENLSIDVLVDDLYELVRTTFPKPKDAPTLVVSI